MSLVAQRSDRLRVQRTMHSNRDGVFDSRDLVDVYTFGPYEDDTPGNSMWETGDWNRDGEFDSSHLALAFRVGSDVG